jgi:hypothetical protein
LGRSVVHKRVILGTKTAGRSHTVSINLIAVVTGAIEHHRPAPGDTTHPGFQYTKRESGGDHRDDAAFGDDGRFADLLGIAELVAHVVACRAHLLKRELPI